jgi:ubiquinone/menaquinone biosynthesis C-methylase UbiE
MQPLYKKYTEANRDAWNEVMPYHQQASREKWDNLFLQPGYVCLGQVEQDLLGQISIRGKAVAHLCCNNGVELMSLKNLGAGECTGFDISDLAIREARERTGRCQIDCQFVRTDVYEIGSEYDNRFDLVYISAGGLGWLPDLKLFFEKAVSMLRQDGQIFIHEIHPFSEMLPFDNTKNPDILRIVEPYFKTEPYVDYGGLDYVGDTQYTSTKPQYWFIHKLSDILMALVENRISIEHFSEYETDISAGHKQVEQARAGIPLSYILIGRKQSTG